jgi:hypothetical protein
LTHSLSLRRLMLLVLMLERSQLLTQDNLPLNDVGAISPR